MSLDNLACRFYLHHFLLMTCKVSNPVLKFSGVLALFFLFFGDALEREPLLGIAGACFGQFYEGFQNSTTRAIFAGLLIFHLCLWHVLGFFRVFSFWRPRCHDLSLWLWLLGAARAVFEPAVSKDAVILIDCAALAQMFAIWSSMTVIRQTSSAAVEGLSFILSTFLILLACASLWQGQFHHVYNYHGGSRWVGPWDNPNVFGLLMGVGALLALGRIFQSWPSNPQPFVLDYLRLRLITHRWFGLGIALVAVGLLWNGLVYSYSRGAWIGAMAGLIFIVARLWAFGSGNGGRRDRHLNSGALSRRRNVGNVLAAALILASVFVLCFWQFRGTAWQPARRAFSAAKVEDFSWRNRVVAWEGAVQIIAEHAWFGTGWNEPERLYEHYYLPPKLSEPAAIEMNDYLMLGATLGVPALFCFFAYIWLSLRTKPDNENHDPSFDVLSATCHAGAVVLLVGFWFDGGLFKLPTAATFWILLELGAVRPQNILTTKNAESAEKKLGI